MSLGFILQGEKNTPNGIPTLTSGKIAIATLPDSVPILDVNSKLATSWLPNNIAYYDASGKLPSSVIPTPSGLLQTSNALSELSSSGAIALNNLGIANATWLNLTIVGGWTINIQPRYTKLTNGLILVTGVINKSSRPGVGEVIATLPTAYRPSQEVRFASFDPSNNSRPYFAINSVGQISYGNVGTIPNTTLGLNLTGIIFHAS